MRDFWILTQLQQDWFSVEEEEKHRQQNNSGHKFATIKPLTTLLIVLHPECIANIVFKCSVESLRDSKCKHIDHHATKADRCQLYGVI
jgi:hypothetical protein